MWEFEDIMDTLKCKVFSHNKKCRQMHKFSKLYLWLNTELYPIIKLLKWFCANKVHAYDPTVSFPPERGNNISFQKLGVAAKRDEAKKMETLKDLMAGNGDDKSRIFYLKVIRKAWVLMDNGYWC